MLGTLFFACFDSVYRHLCFIPHILSHDDAVEQIVSRRLSLARFGDGELKVMLGADINFQHTTPQLSERLKEVFLSRNSNLLVGIPDVFDHLERYNATEQIFWQYHLRFRRWHWHRYIRRTQWYASTFLSRFYSMEYDAQLAQNRLLLLRRLWEGRNILFIEGSETKMGVGNDLFQNAASIRRILCPAKDAFSSYDSILKATIDVVQSDDLIILALGPTATILAADLCELGLQALDLGHIDIEYEWYLQRVTSKTGVKGKFSNEAFLNHLADVEIEGELSDDSYFKQIVAIVE